MATITKLIFDEPFRCENCGILMFCLKNEEKHNDYMICFLGKHVRVTKGVADKIVVNGIDKLLQI